MSPTLAAQGAAKYVGFSQYVESASARGDRCAARTQWTEVPVSNVVSLKSKVKSKSYPIESKNMEPLKQLKDFSFHDECSTERISQPIKIIIWLRQ